jgi:hypothetical protein
MYVELLSSALGGQLEELTSDELLSYVLERRAAVLDSGSGIDVSAYSALAIEVAYDGALLKLCRVNGIDVNAADFSSPTQERRRLERELASIDIDLTELARRRRTR